MSPVIGDCLPTGIHDSFILASLLLMAISLLGLLGWLLISRSQLKRAFTQQKVRNGRRQAASQQERLL